MIRLLLLMLFCSTVSFADDEIPTPEFIDGAAIVNANEVKSLIAKQGTIVVDNRNLLNFGRGHIPGAISLAYDDQSTKTFNFDHTKDKFDFSKLPKDRNTTIIFYSHGDTGWKSYKAARAAVINGYRNVKWMREGYNAWRSVGYPVTID